MKKTKIFSVVTLIVAFVLIFTGYSMIFIDEYRVDAKETELYTSLLKVSFDAYNLKLEEISNNINNMDIFDTNYYEEIKNNYEKNINLLNEIEYKLKSIETTSNILLYECESNNYDVNKNQCNIIKLNYESIINAYISLIEKYNIKFERYNNWNNQEQELLTLYYSSFYNKYIDVNYDGEYSGIIS